MPRGGDEPVAGLAEAVDELYVLPPEDFTERRDALAAEVKAAGDKALAAAVKKLRRPTASAWALNLLGREEAGLVAQLLEVGAALREAQEGLDGAALRELNEQRRGVVGALARRAGALAQQRGHALDATMSRQVEQSLAAALADPEAGAAVTSGQLVRPVESSGFGFTVDPEATAVPSLVLVRGGKAPSGRSETPARPSSPKAVPPGGAATGSLDDARAKRAARGKAGRAAADRAEAEREAERAEQARREAEEAEQARREVEEAEQERQRAEAEAALQAAREAVEKARVTEAERRQDVADAGGQVEELRASVEALQTERDELQARLAEVEEQLAETGTAWDEQQARQQDASAAVTAAAKVTKAAERALSRLEKRP